MITTLKKYLDSFSLPAVPAGSGGPGTGGLRELVDRVLCAIGEYAFHDDRYQPSRNAIQDHRATVRHAASIEEIRTVAAAVESLLEAYRSEESWFQVTQASEMQKILAMLNETLVVLSTGSDRSISRLRKIEKALGRAQAIPDIVALKETVAETMDFVRTETHKERETTAKVLARTEESFRRARKALAAANSFPGREEALKILAAALRSEARERCYVGIFVVERYAAIAARFGGELAGDIIQGFLRERLASLTSSGGAFQWTPGCVAVIMERDCALAQVRAEVAAVTDAVYEYKVYMDEKVVPVRLSSRWMLCRGADWEPEVLIAEIDAFAGVSEPAPEAVV